MKAFNEEILLLIEQYIRGELKGSALLQFKQKIAQDDDLKKEINIRKSIIGGISDYGKLRKRIKDLDQEVQAEKKKKKWPLVLVATLIFFILGSITYFSFFKKNDVHLEQIIADISVDSKYTPKIRVSRGDTSIGLEREFKNSYDNGKYSYCIGVCDILPNDSLFNELSIYCGFSNESPGQYKKAINIYDSIIQRNEKYVTEALFHKAFCHMQLKEKDECIAALNLVVASREDSPFQEKAKSLLDDLRKLNEEEWKE